METTNSTKYLYYEPKTKRWSVYVREPWVKGKRIFLGTHESQRLAIRCQDRAKLKLEAELAHMSTAEREIKKVQPIILEFPREDYEDDKGGKRDTLSRKEFFKYLAHESRAKYQQYKPTPCLLKFLAEEREYESLSRSSSQKLNEEVKRAHIVQRRNHGNLRRQSQAPRLGITLRLKR
uniref:AP2/ERF domain-containing protein n=1 Tax=Physcomitrium patens TaxID=3218 RepID=A0A2K1KJ44_PHYPA|nr:hypothetical protein PHYPA_007475 [Physcomitrium patens]